MDRFGASVEARFLQLMGREARGPRRRLPRRVHRGPRPRHPRDRGAEARRPARPRAIPPHARRGRVAGAPVDRGHPRPVRRAVRLLLPGIRARGEGRDRGSRGAAARGGQGLRRRKAPCGSARPTTATTRIASLVRSNGQHTYFGADCAYLIDKFSRGFDHVVYVWGADHHGDVARVKGAAEALGYDPDAVELGDLPMGGVPAGRRAGADGQARRATSSRSTSCSTRSAPTPPASSCSCTRTTRR